MKQRRNLSDRAIELAREARKDPSVAETLVWKWLRDRKQEFKFRREYPIGPFRLDFYCAAAKLGVELDGEQHDADRDAKRDAFIEGLGIAVYRIPNRAFFLLDREEYVDHLSRVLELCRERTGQSESRNPHPPTPSP